MVCIFLTDLSLCVFSGYFVLMCVFLTLDPVSPPATDIPEDEVEVPVKRLRHQDTLPLFKRQRFQEEPLDLSVSKTQRDTPDTC